MESKATPGGQKKRPRGPQEDQKGVQGDPRSVQGDPKRHPKAYLRRTHGPGVPGRGKEFLPETPGSKFAIGKTSSYKQPSCKQIKNKALKTQHIQLKRTGVPEGTVRIY